MWIKLTDITPYSPTYGKGNTAKWDNDSINNYYVTHFVNFNLTDYVVLVIL